MKRDRIEIILLILAVIIVAVQAVLLGLSGISIFGEAFGEPGSRGASA